MKRLIIAISCSALSFSLLTGFSFDDLKKKVDKSYKCDDDDKSCKNKEHAKAAAKVAAVIVAAKLIADMVIEYNAKQVSGEAEVIKKYKKTHKTLPKEALALDYSASSKLGKVVSSGQKVLIQSRIEVMPGSTQKTTVIEERLSIYDNEDPTKELTSMTKVVNSETGRAGIYENEFTFTLPKGMPQGEYPLKSTLLVNGKESKTAKHSLQLVQHILLTPNEWVAQR
ncbi:MAG: hypothetical protein HRU20_07130 [Pseudomonadales bacterium]|nr:hypothetical protein [Pseudomonadales bacterium]